ncbi:gamma-glutamylcyclotransferase [Roseococcus sp. YIM B11640]|uniref:gamma-glutamylcyclotransferase n=1 Tax=Roseococcus sp. YIM B11640 TaxID=3133973 RepID=UPI003C7DC2F9
MSSLPLDADGHLYVFAYGSLIWRPDFVHLGQESAVLRGYHRRFCLTSRHYRGTPETPGLVLGLDRGGTCRGVAFRVCPDAAPEVLDYLEARENVNGEMVYDRRLLPLRLGSGREVRGIAYVANRSHPAYCRPCEASTAETIARGRGQAGTNLDYLLNTARQLASMGLRDSRLERLVKLATAEVTCGQPA